MWMTGNEETRTPSAVVDHRCPVPGHLGDLGVSPGLAGVPAQGLHVPGVRRPEMLGVGAGSQIWCLPGGSPDLDRVAATGLGQAPHKGRHVADVVGVQVGQEHLRRGRHRQTQTVVVGQGTGPEVEEEQVPIGVAHLDQQRRRRLARLHERVTRPQDRDPDLAISHRLRRRRQDRRQRSGRRPHHRGRRQRRSTLERQLGQFSDLNGHSRTPSCQTPHPDPGPGDCSESRRGGGERECRILTGQARAVASHLKVPRRRPWRRSGRSAGSARSG